MGKIMNNKEILEAAQKNKERGREFENQSADLGHIFSHCVTLVVCIIFFIVDYFIKDYFNTGLITIAVSSIASQMLYEGIRCKKIIYTIIGIILSIVALLIIVGRVILP